MRTFVIEGKPLEEVTIKVKGQSLTLTEGVEVTVIVVVASQQSVQADETYPHEELAALHNQIRENQKVLHKAFRR